MAKNSGGNRRHVTQHAEGWAVRKPGASRASVVVPTQAEAAERAREIVTNLGGGEVTIHGRDGKIRDSDTIGGGNDPHPPKDSKH